MMQKIVFTFFLISSFCSSQAANLFIDDPQILGELETKGFDLPRLVFNETSPKPNNELLIKNESYAFIAKNLAAELEELKKEDPKLFISMRGSHRLFDSQWLRG